MSKNNPNPRGTVASVPPKAPSHNHQTPMNKHTPTPAKNNMRNTSQQRELPKVTKLPPPPPPKR